MALSVPRLLPTKTYPFSDVRHMFAASGIQAGVMATGATTEFKVTQDTGSNMSIKVAQGDSGAWVLGLDTTRQGGYHVYNDAAITTAVTAANATNPRIDQVVLRVYDSTVIGGGTDAAAIEVIAGTATAGATLDNRTGAANLATIAAPKTLIRLADVLVPAASTAVTNANIRDRRPWALGAYVRIVRTAGNYSITTTTAGTAIDATNLAPRIECTGVPVRVTLSGFWQSTVQVQANFGINANGSGWDSTTAINAVYPSAAGQPQLGGVTYTGIPSPVSVVFAPTFWNLTAATATLFAAAGNPLVFTVEELVRQNTANT